MNDICRFCLNVSTQELCNLQGDMLCRIQSHLLVHISSDDSLPNQICKECINKIEQIFEFCSKIKENEQKLQQYLVDGSLQDYYLRITNNIHVKEEKNKQNFIFCESEYLKTEHINGVLDINISIDEQENDKINRSTDCDDLKMEESVGDDFNVPTCSTDDEISLSSIKNNKGLKNHSSKENHKRIRKARPRKTSKSKRKIDIQNNIDTNTDSVKQFTCLSCSTLCDTQIELIKHYNVEHLNKHRTDVKQTYTMKETNGNVTYKCDCCEKTCSNKKDIVKHIAIHNDERPLICKLCGRMYKTVTEIIRHARVHNGFKLQCSYKCGYTTAYQGALKEHENRHKDMYKYTCEKCGKGFYVKTWYEQHQNLHNGLKPFVCDICGLAFHMDRYLTAHRSQIHPQSSSVKRYICVHCNQKCDSANSLALHLEEHGINKEKEFLCDFCGKILSSADQLKYHHRMHLGVKPYSCSICNKTFAKKFNVKVHMSSHSGEKTHSCTRCGKRYTQRSTLLRHLRRHHSGASPKRIG